MSQQQETKPKSIVQIDHEADSNDTALFVPGLGNLPLVGATSGLEYDRLKKAEIEKREFNRRIVAALHKAWQCVQCKRIWRCRFNPETGHPLKYQRVVIIERTTPLNGGPRTEVLVCPYVDQNGKKCRGPVVEYKEPQP